MTKPLFLENLEKLAETREGNQQNRPNTKLKSSFCPSWHGVKKAMHNDKDGKLIFRARTALDKFLLRKGLILHPLLSR